MLKIPPNMEIVPREASGRLLEKQWRARIALRRNPLAYGMNQKWRVYFRNKTKKRTSVYSIAKAAIG